MSVCLRVCVCVGVRVRVRVRARVHARVRVRVTTLPTVSPAFGLRSPVPLLQWCMLSVVFQTPQFQVGYRDRVDRIVVGPSGMVVSAAWKFVRGLVSENLKQKVCAGPCRPVSGAASRAQRSPDGAGGFAFSGTATGS